MDELRWTECRFMYFTYICIYIVFYILFEIVNRFVFVPMEKLKLKLKISIEVEATPLIFFSSCVC